MHLENGSWDDWVTQERIRKFTEENKELAANLKAEMEKLHNPPKLKAALAKKKAAGSDLSSTRGSEERLTPVTGRGQKRGRDYEIEKVRARSISTFFFYFEIPQPTPSEQRDRKSNGSTPASNGALSGNRRVVSFLVTSHAIYSSEKSKQQPPVQRLWSIDSLLMDFLSTFAAMTYEIPDQNYNSIEGVGR
jgi:hypothetical protein